MLLRAINKIKEDIKVIYEKDPAANNIAEVIFCYPGFQALLMHRIAHKLAYSFARVRHFAKKTAFRVNFPMFLHKKLPILLQGLSDGQNVLTV